MEWIHTLLAMALWLDYAYVLHAPYNPSSECLRRIKPQSFFPYNLLARTEWNLSVPNPDQTCRNDNCGVFPKFPNIHLMHGVNTTQEVKNEKIPWTL